MNLLAAYPILTMETARGCPDGAHPDRPGEWAVYMTWPEGAEPPLLPAVDEIAERPPVVAFVEWSRWVGRCPWCNQQQIVSGSDPRFMCVRCFNNRAGGVWLRVVFPRERAQIEMALMPRTRDHRHWLPHESVADLLAENEAHGL